MGSLYRSQHELIFVFRAGKGQHINDVRLGRYGRNRTNAWQYQGVNTFRRGRMEELRMHPSVKPVALVADAILDCSKRDGIVLDGFAGSGTTILLELVRRIEVRQDRIRVVFLTEPLRSMLGVAEAGKNHGGDAFQEQVELDAAVQFKRRGAELKLVIADERDRLPAPDPKLISVVAQGRALFEQLRTGQVASVGALAARHGIDQGDVSRLIQLAFLAPDIVEAIIEGRQPVELTASRLKRIRNLPPSWTEQQRRLGFA